MDSSFETFGVEKYLVEYKNHEISDSTNEGINSVIFFCQNHFTNFNVVLKAIPLKKKTKKMKSRQEHDAQLKELFEKIIGMREDAILSKNVNCFFEDVNRIEKCRSMLIFNIIEYRSVWIEEICFEKNEEYCDSYKVLFIEMEKCIYDFEKFFQNVKVIEWSEKTELETPLPSMSMTEFNLSSFIIENFFYISESLCEIHRTGFGHGDLKLQNIFVRSLEFIQKKGSICMADFGQSSLVSTNSEEESEGEKSVISRDLSCLPFLAGSILEILEERYEKEFEGSDVKNILTDLENLFSQNQYEGMKAIKECLLSYAKEKGFGNLKISNKDVRNEISNIYNILEQSLRTVEKESKERKRLEKKMDEFLKIYEERNKKNNCSGKCNVCGSDVITRKKD